MEFNPQEKHKGSGPCGFFHLKSFLMLKLYIEYKHVLHQNKMYSAHKAGNPSPSTGFPVADIFQVP
jgi:hypothetical protein